MGFIKDASHVQKSDKKNSFYQLNVTQSHSNMSTKNQQLDVSTRALSTMMKSTTIYETFKLFFKTNRFQKNASTKKVHVPVILFNNILLEIVNKNILDNWLTTTSTSSSTSTSCLFMFLLRFQLLFFVPKEVPSTNSNRSAPLSGGRLVPTPGRGGARAAPPRRGDAAGRLPLPQGQEGAGTGTGTGGVNVGSFGSCCMCWFGQIFWEVKRLMFEQNWLKTNENNEMMMFKSEMVDSKDCSF